jgi:hypothetical protein
VALEPESPEAMQAEWLAQSGADPRALLHVLDMFVETPATALGGSRLPTQVVACDQDERKAEKLAAALYVQVPTTPSRRCSARNSKPRSPRFSRSRRRT